MMKQQIFSIVFSIILLLANFRCAFWLFQEAMNLTGMTFKEFLEMTSSDPLSFSTGRHRLRKRQQFFTRFFQEKSIDPQKSIRLLWTFGMCTLPGLAALNLAVYAAMHMDKLKYAFMGNLILVVINLLLVIWGKIYRKNNPFDERMAELFNQKQIQEKEYGRQKSAKNKIVYVLVCAFFLGMVFFFMKGISGISMPLSQQSAISIHADLITLLNEKGYETANIPTTYWELDQDKLLHVAAGVKSDSKFEFYGYSDDQTVDLVYNQIVYLIAPELEGSDREKHETTLPEGNRVFSMEIEGAYYLVMYRNDTVIYAYSQDSLNEAYEILVEIGYLTKDSKGVNKDDR